MKEAKRVDSLRPEHLKITMKFCSQPCIRFHRHPKGVLRVFFHRLPALKKPESALPSA